MVLRRATIQDFLSIRGRIEIDVDRQVTILLGANDHGKSNILRAISCLNPEQAITEDERNWDAKGPPVLSYQFDLTSQEARDLGLLLDQECAECLRRAEAIIQEQEVNEATDGDESAAATPVQPPSPAKTTMPAKGGVKAIEVDDEDDDEDDISDLERAQNLKKLAENLQVVYTAASLRNALVLSRAGVGEELAVGGTRWSELPATVTTFLGKLCPRVELFQATAGTLQDSVLDTEIGTEGFEFLQGVFFYAGLDPLKCDDLFAQNDKTERQLDEASKRLNEELRRIWVQGVDLGLQFELRHRGNAIEFLANDPAVKTRKTRMSKRSAGVTQFFKFSMVLHARRTKNPANSYIFLFDEPGIYLHPKGQKDLMQVFEELSTQTQIVYATHSLFLLNQNHPERHRLVVRNETGTIIDQKPYRANWRLATDALGVQLTANILFSPAVLLVEGDSDPLYLYELLRELNRAGEIDADANMLGIYSYENLPNLRFLLQTFRHDNHGAKVAVLCDGDASGKRTHKAIKALCEAHQVPRLILEDNKVIEDYVLDMECFVNAVTDTVNSAAEALAIELPSDVTDKVREACKGDGKHHAAERFKLLCKKLLKEEASKVALARNYVFHCREKLDVIPEPSRKA